MAKTKEETNIEILNSASANDNDISKVRVRHTDSAHPVDCSCDLCKQLRFGGPIDEDTTKKVLDWSDE